MRIILEEGVRTPRRRRSHPHKLSEPPTGTDLEALAKRASYVGSPEHKDRPSFAGQPRPRADASICDPSLAGSQDELTQWLRKAICNGCIGSPWEGDFRRYAWYKKGDFVYEARLVNRGTGEYKGYPLHPNEWPEGLG